MEDGAAGVAAVPVLGIIDARLSSSFFLQEIEPEAVITNREINKRLRVFIGPLDRKIYE